MYEFFSMVDTRHAGTTRCPGVAVKQPEPPETLTILYDGECPLCRREIAHVKGLAERRSDSALCFIDIARGTDEDSSFAADRAKLLARFHVQRSDGSRLDGAAAFVLMWSRLPGWRWLARLARLPGVLALFELAYRGFLLVRPRLQTLARYWETTRGETGVEGAQRVKERCE